MSIETDTIDSFHPGDLVEYNDVEYIVTDSWAKPLLQCDTGRLFYREDVEEWKLHLIMAGLRPAPTPT